MEWISASVYKKYKILKQKQQSTYADGFLMQAEQKMRP
jgi:2-phosphoglycerate kinase